MINVNDFKTGVTISYEGNIYQVIDFQHVKPGKGAAIVKAKLKNLRTGATLEQTFNAGIKISSSPTLPLLTVFLGINTSLIICNH